MRCRLCLFAVVAAVFAGAPARGESPDQLRQRALAIFAPLPPVAESKENPVTEEKVRLGRVLYYDARLSVNDKISCNSCHQLDRFGVDNEKTSPGHDGRRGDRNSPTVYNAAFQIAQFWDGRARDVEEQAKGPILNPIEMGMPSAEAVVAKLEKIPGYLPLFRAAFPGQEKPITYDNIARAIGAFERKLVTPSRFDDFLKGDNNALNEKERAGLAKFMDTGCITCHNGPLVGGAMFQKLGLVKPYPTQDPGRAKVTGNELERGFFKVPSLRNVAKTAPYLHDGSVASLPEMVKIMAEYQLGRTLADGDVQDIVAFLDALTGRIDQQYIAKPELPK
ncbi:MAG: cytochrome-c peroxidase [Candidatus Binatia bacterium]|nr:MAG: cytochrome-c peroxidase [Candidatus Binatia bacterium]